MIISLQKFMTHWKIISILNLYFQDESISDETPDQNNESDQENLKVAENHVTMQIFQLIEHYKKEDPIGLPVVPIPDPLKVLYLHSFQ
jgi:hypothetical protein